MFDKQQPLPTKHLSISFYSHYKKASDSSDFTIPFSRVGNLILLKAKVDSTEGNFILDTGCPGLVLNITYFRDYPRTSESDDDNKGITGPVSNVEHANIYEFNFGNQTLFNTKADLINLGHIENNKGVKILGLIGMSFLENCELLIDFENNLLHFHLISKKEFKTYKNTMLLDTSKYNTIPFDVADNRIVLTTEFLNRKLKFIVDCAAETSILNSKVPNNILNQLQVTGKVLITGVGNKKVEALKADLKNFTIANKKIEVLPFIITNLEKTCFSYGGCIDGVLGFDFLSLQKIGFNFATHQMYLWK